MHCAACKGNIENKLKRTKGIKDVNANLVSSVVSVVYDENIINSTKIVEICRVFENSADFFNAKLSLF